MRKYLAVAAATFKSQLAFRFDIALNAVFTVSKILLARILWGAAFGGAQTLGGFTLDAMITYYIVQAFFSQLDMSPGMGGEIADRIRGGSFSGRMVLPIDIFGLFAAQSVGASAFHLTFNLISAAIWTLLFRVRFAWGGGPAALAWALILLALGLVFMMQMQFLVGILAFRFLDVWLFRMVLGNVLAFATGALIPLNLLPGALIVALRFTPLYAASYLPAMLVMGRELERAATAAIVCLVWILALAAINRLAYERLRVRYDGVGI